MSVSDLLYCACVVRVEGKKEVGLMSGDVRLKHSLSRADESHAKPAGHASEVRAEPIFDRL